MKYTNNTFTETVTLDGNEFDICIFDGCSLVYRGGPPPILNDCQFAGTRFQFEGAAANTVAFVQAMAAPGSGLQSVVRDTFPALGAH